LFQDAAVEEGLLDAKPRDMTAVRKSVTFRGCYLARNFENFHTTLEMGDGRWRRGMGGEGGGDERENER